MRPRDGAQRGSVMDMPVYPGDPLTPGVGATPDAKRLAVKDAPTLTKIPVMPISYADAQPLLASLTGAVVPAEWRGGLPITYRFGPGAGRAHLKLAFNWDQKPLYDVIARLRGSTFPDQWVMRGNHHDAWVNGAEDPVSGLAAMLEEARSARRAAQAGLGAEADDRLLRVGRRRAGAARIDRMGRDARRRAAAESGRLPELRRQRPRLPRSRGLAHARALHQRRGARHHRSGNEADGLEAAAGARHRSREAGRQGEGPQPRRLAHRRARIRLRLHAVPAAPRHPDAEHRLRRRGRRAASITRSTTTSISSRTSSTPTSPTAARWRRRRARRSSGWPTPTSCRSSSRISSTRCGPTTRSCSCC